MKQQQVLETIPVALEELHEAGFEEVYVDQLGQQITRHDESYLHRRANLRHALGYIGIHLPELPDGHFRPSPSKMYASLRQLEDDGVVKGVFEAVTDGNKPPRRKYSLVTRD